MTKKELIEMVKDLADDEEVVVEASKYDREYDCEYTDYYFFLDKDKIVGYSEAKEKLEEKYPDAYYVVTENFKPKHEFNPDMYIYSIGRRFLTKADVTDGAE